VKALKIIFGRKPFDLFPLYFLRESPESNPKTTNLLPRGEVLFRQGLSLSLLEESFSFEFEERNKKRKTAPSLDNRHHHTYTFL